MSLQIGESHLRCKDHSSYSLDINDLAAKLFLKTDEEKPQRRDESGRKCYVDRRGMCSSESQARSSRLKIITITWRRHWPPWWPLAKDEAAKKFDELHYFFHAKISGWARRREYWQSLKL